ncbi:MAG: hypothetical protein J6Y20_11580 [Lachnospiraceae bacterium]|nr:hypothetical protein [Lachnospiraceae bacterium]
MKYNSKVVLGDGTVLIDLTSDTVVADKVLSGYTAHGKDGAPFTGTCDYDADTSDDTATAAEILATKTAHARGTALNGTMPNNGAVAGKITTKAGVYTVPHGYHDGSGTVAIDSTEQAKIIAENIRQGVTILGIEGSMSGSEDIVAQSKNATPTFSQQTILPDSGYTHLTSVVVAAIPVTYVDNAAGGKTVTIG